MGAFMLCTMEVGIGFCVVRDVWMGEGERLSFGGRCVQSF